MSRDALPSQSKRPVCWFIGHRWVDIEGRRVKANWFIGAALDCSRCGAQR